MIGAFLAGTSKDIIHLIVYRGIQGLGAGIIMATAFTAIGDLFSPRERGRWSGLMSAVLGVSSILGPGLGGYIVDHLEWHWVFWFFLPLGLLAFFLIFILFPKVERREAESIDYPGSLLLTLTIVLMLLAFSWAGTKYSWGSSQVLGLFVFAIVSLALFIFAETKVRTPVLPLYLFKDSVVTVCNLTSFIINAGMFGAIIYMPFFVQGVMGVSATYAGYVTMPMSLSMFALSAYSGRRMTKTGKYKGLALSGISMMIIGMLVMAVMNNIPVAVLSMIIFGCGLGLGMPVFMLSVQNAVDAKDLGVATSSVQLFRNLGGTIGVAVMGTILSTGIADKMKGIVGINPEILDPAMAQRLSQFQNPQVLLDQSKLAVIQNSMPAPLQSLFAQLIESLRGALAASLSNVFLAGAVLLVAALILTFFLKEVPLRTWVHKVSNVSAGKPEETAPGMNALTIES